jgi:endoglucanase
VRSGVIVTAVGLLLACSAAIPVTATTPMSVSTLDPATQFFVPPPLHGAVAQVAELKAAGDHEDAALVRAMIDTAQAVWFTGGSPKAVEKGVRQITNQAADKGRLPVLVAYNVPGRDCSQYSAGGAATGDAYRAWIEGFTAGLGDRRAIVILEPDGLALTPTDCGQPDTYDRVDLINRAASRLADAPGALVYLDAGHSSWHNVADMASRLVAGGVLDVQGFYLNPSNYQYSSNLVHYGTWISECIAFATEVSPGNYACPDQYWNGGPHPAKIADLLGEWTGVALSPYGTWSDDSDDPALNTSGENVRYASMLGATEPTVHFVIDTSRNGVGPWPGVAGHPASDGATQDWCNPPDRGLGIRPTADTSVALLDAYLWIKIPGASDGECTRWDPSGGIDPVRGSADPAAGEWFPDMALELVHNANP